MILYRLYWKLDTLSLTYIMNSWFDPTDGPFLFTEAASWLSHACFVVFSKIIKL